MEWYCNTTYSLISLKSQCVDTHISISYCRSRDQRVQLVGGRLLFVSSLTIPLRDFGDSKEIEKRQEESMMIGVQPEGAEPDETVVVKIPADQLPPVLQATVKSRRGQRKSKGFSRNEIISAGITMGAVERLHIPYDRRRKTSHSWRRRSRTDIKEKLDKYMFLLLIKYF